MARKLSTVSLACAIALGGVSTADAAKRFTIRGAGFGHGVGMSQYGAMGYAQHGWDYKAILGHYYTGTELGVLKAPRDVRVLLQSTSGERSRKASATAVTRFVAPGPSVPRHTPARCVRRPYMSAM